MGEDDTDEKADDDDDDEEEEEEEEEEEGKAEEEEEMVWSCASPLERPLFFTRSVCIFIYGKVETCAIVSLMHDCMMYYPAEYDGMVTNTATLHMAW